MRIEGINAWLHHSMTAREMLRWWSLKRAISWREYLFAGLLAYLLPIVGLGIEWSLTWQNKLSLIGHFGLPNLGDIMELMGIPGLISFLVFLPLLRYPVRCRLAAILVSLVWIMFLFSTEVAVH